MTDVITFIPTRPRYRRRARLVPLVRPVTFRQVANVAALVACALAVAACLLIPFAIRLAGVDLDFVCAVAATPCAGLAILGNREP